MRTLRLGNSHGAGAGSLDFEAALPLCPTCLVAGKVESGVDLDTMK